MVSHIVPSEVDHTYNDRFEMPEIPPEWRPRPARVWGTTRRWDEGPGEKAKEKEAIRGVPAKALTFEEVSPRRRKRKDS
jgi:hypothetical protein